jgi:aspartyl-tRNA synthetase
LELTGIIKKRLEGTINKDMPTGEVELIVDELIIQNISKTPPFKIDDEKTNEDLRTSV